MEIKGKLTIKCERCGKPYDFTEEDVRFLISEENEENPYYTWELNFDCLRCGNPIKIRYTIYLFPDGKVKGKTVDVQGAKVTEDSFEFSDIDLQTIYVMKK